jgi:succinate-semialdehyde dehydrogenase/glutarate-semialdehyde dehydrogenase
VSAEGGCEVRRFSVNRKSEQMTYRSFDPYRQLLLAEFPCNDRVDASAVKKGSAAWMSFSLEERALCFNRLADLLETEQHRLAELITQEIGKPLNESVAEINKCAGAVRQLTKVAPFVLKDRLVHCEAKLAKVVPVPFGTLLAVLPWNFPFWQFFRFAVSPMLAGNTVLLKHAPNVPRCAMALTELFSKAGFPEGVVIHLFLSDKGVADAIRLPFIHGVAFTGSDATGSLIAETAGRNLKKTILELGGNDPMIVFADADIDAAAQAAVASRCINGGQACNGAKRFIVEETVQEKFVRVLTEGVRALKQGDPRDSRTSIGPVARFDLLERIRKQVSESISQGAKAIYSADGVPEGWFFPPTVLTGVQPGMTAFEEEIFGPVWSVTAFRTREEAIELANASRYGLGASVWSDDETLIERMITKLDTGNVFINDFVRSDPRFPFGGVKSSGYGKDLGEEGFTEFVNWKTVYWKR